MISRPLRSVLLGDCDYYPSEYIFGVAQGMTRLGHWHSQVNLRAPWGAIVKRVEEMRPDIVWGHMLLWAPPGAPERGTLLTGLATWRRRWGTRVVIHDGDAKADTRYPFNISEAVDLALCNHQADRSPWRIATLHWPYFAFTQNAPAPPDPSWSCELFFAGRKGTDATYAARTEFVDRLHARLGDRMMIRPRQGEFPTLFLTPTIAASARAVLGFGRMRSTKGWVDVRVFQYPGAGGVLLHDDVQGFLEPGIHFLPYKSGSIESVETALALASERGPKIREEAFRYVQAYHSSVPRVQQVLRALELG